MNMAVNGTTDMNGFRKTNNTTCRCCEASPAWWESRKCPLCSFAFDRASTKDGWGGFEEHWKTHHSNEGTYADVWANMCIRHKKYRTVVYETNELHAPIVVELYLLGGKAEIGDKKPGKDRPIFERIAARIGLSQIERNLKVGDYHPLNLHHQERNGWDYSLQVAIQHMKFRCYAGYDRPFMQYSEKRGLWELSPTGMEYGKKLAAQAT